MVTTAAPCPRSEPPASSQPAPWTPRGSSDAAGAGPPPRQRRARPSCFQKRALTASPPSGTRVEAVSPGGREQRELVLQGVRGAGASAAHRCPRRRFQLPRRGQSPAPRPCSAPALLQRPPRPDSGVHSGVPGPARRCVEAPGPAGWRAGRIPGLRCAGDAHSPLTPDPGTKQADQVSCCTNVFHLSKRKT